MILFRPLSGFVALAATVVAQGLPPSEPSPRAPAVPSEDSALQLPPAPFDPDAFRGTVIHRSDSGVWYLHAAKVVPAFGQPELIAADDKGRLSVLSVYSGNWTEHGVIADGQWLAPSRPADVDPRVDGAEIYAAGHAGSVHRITMRQQPAARFTFESREIGHAAGEEFHAIVAADLIPGGSAELLVFGITGAVFRLHADPTGDGFRMRQVALLPGRVRDVAVLDPGRAGEARTMLGVSRSGHLLRMRLGEDGLAHEIVLAEDCGLGRIALGREPGVVYVTRDDGVLLRLVATGEGLVREVIYAGGQGLRGVAAGRFFADGREAVAVFGYDRRVHLVAREAERWRAETIWLADDRGHWLVAAELDGRNGTDELVASGFDGAVVLLARPPGYGLPGAAVPAEERSAVVR